MQTTMQQPDPEPETDHAPSEALELRIGDWLWRPWYAKLWWVAIPVYWLPAGGPFRIAALAPIYTSTIGICLNVLLLPITALVILGFGYARAWLDDAEWVEGGYRGPDDVRFYRRPGAPHPSLDPYEPRSGNMYNGIARRHPWED